MTVATNKYVEYWKNQARSISDANITGLGITIHVFTDDTKAVESFSKNLSVRVITHEIPSLGWPDATLLRYKLISQFSETIHEDILMHLDADMLLHRAISAEELVSGMKNGICLVRHPGF
jgi:chaperone required for assembly of F1-ATPase